MSAEQAYIEATAKARWLFAAIVGFFLACVLMGEWILPGYLHVSEDPSPSELKAVQYRLILVSGSMVLIALIVSVFWTRYFWRVGKWAISHSECPPPDTLVVRRTRVATGRRAQIEGWASVFLAIIPWAVVALFAYLFILNLELL